MRSRPWLLALLGAMFVACGGRSMHSGADSGDDSGGSVSGGTTSNGGAASAGASSRGGAARGGSTHGGSTNGGVSHGGAATGGAAAAGAASAGDTGTDQCDPANYGDAQGKSIAVRLVNGTNDPIYLGPRMQGCGLGRLFSVDDASGQPLNEPGFCEPTCEQWIDGDVAPCPPILCPVSAVVTLQPGESRLQSWDGLYLKKVTLPLACGVGPRQCSQVTLAEPGDYVFSADAGSSQQCLVPQGGCNVCTPDLNGGCATAGTVTAGAALRAEAKVTLDESYFAGAGGRPMLKPVDVVFHD
jgi:hypothetical protein